MTKRYQMNIANKTLNNLSNILIIVKMKNKVGLLFFLFIVFNIKSIAQNGKIIFIQNTSIEDSDKVFFQKRFLETDEVLKQTSLEKITYLSDGFKISGYIAKPIISNKKFPCIIYCRGGNRDFGALSSFEQFYLQRMANWGYIVIASQYRGGPDSEGKDEFGGNDINDVMNLLPVLSQIKNADTSKIGIHGWSRGGMMTYLALKKTNRFKAAVVGAGAADLYSTLKLRKDFEAAVFAECIPDYYKNKDVELKKRSVVYWADSLCKTTPILLMQGSSDWRVSPEENLDLVGKLYKAKHPLKFIFYAGGDHGLREYTTETDAQMKQWFDDYVRDGKALPNMEKHGR